MDRITKYTDAGKLPLSVFLDLAKAFDTIDHKNFTAETEILWRLRYTPEMAQELPEWS